MAPTSSRRLLPKFKLRATELSRLSTVVEKLAGLPQGAPGLAAQVEKLRRVVAGTQERDVRSPFLLRQPREIAQARSAANDRRACASLASVVEFFLHLSPLACEKCVTVGGPRWLGARHTPAAFALKMPTPQAEFTSAEAIVCTAVCDKPDDFAEQCRAVSKRAVRQLCPTHLLAALTFSAPSLSSPVACSALRTSRLTAALP